MKALIVAALAGATAVFILKQPLWSRMLAALFVGIGTFLLYGLYSLMANIATAPQRKRQTVQFGPRTYRVVGHDLMQMHAMEIVHLIDEYCRRRGRGMPEKPEELRRIWGKIRIFGNQATVLEISGWRSRRRARKLYEQISASRNLGEIRLLCLRYHRLKPRR